MDGANFNDPAFVFWSLVFLVFCLFVVLAIVYGFLRSVHAAWVLARSAGDSGPHAMGTRQDDLYGDGARRPVGPPDRQAREDPIERDG